MKNKREIRLPKKHAPKGLYLWCNTHKKFYKDDSKVKSPCTKCNLVYKTRIHIPTRFVGYGEKKTTCWSFNADSYEEAIQIFYDYKAELKRNSYQRVSFKEKETSTPFLLKDCIDLYNDYKNDIGVSVHLKKNLTLSEKNTTKRALKYMVYAMIENGLKPEIFIFEDINDKIVEFTVDYFKGPLRQMKPKTFKNHIDPLKAFMKYMIDNYYPNMKNHFLTVQTPVPVKSKTTISKAEFIQVMQLIDKDNMQVSYNNRGKKRSRSLYRDWLGDAFMLGLFTGGRKEETVMMRWSDIKLNEENEISYIEVADLKYNRRKNLVDKEVQKVKNVEMTPEFEKMLMDLGYEEKKNSSDYIFLPDETFSRKYIADIVSSAFNLLINKLELPKKKEFKNLRKTYVTKCFIEDPEGFYKRTGHSCKYVAERYYVDMGMVMEERRKILYKQKGN